MIRKSLLLCLVSFFLTGCAYYSKMAVPKRLVTEGHGQVTVVKHVKESATGFRIFTIPVSIPSANKVANNAIDQNGGDGIANLEVDFSEFNIFIVSFPHVTVEGDVVKK